MTIYSKEKGTMETLIARDVAPLAAHETMYGNATSVTGGLSIAVPGELKGYWELHKKYGKLPWARLFQPTVDLCREGHVVSDYLERILTRNEATVRASPSLAEIYINPQTNAVYRVGDRVKRLQLANTLELIAKEGIDPIYNNGTLAQQIVKEIKEHGGIITVEDFMQYEVRWETPVTAKLTKGRTMHSHSLPGSGAMIAFMVNVLHGHLPQGNSPQSFIRLAEAMKYAYAQRTQLADPRFVSSALEVIDREIDFFYKNIVGFFYYRRLGI